MDPSAQTRFWLIKKLIELTEHEFAWETGLGEPTVQKLSQGKRTIRDNHWKKVALGVGAEGATAEENSEFIGCVLGSGEFSREEFEKWRAFARKSGQKLLEQVHREERNNLALLLSLASERGKLFLAHELLVEALVGIVKSLHLQESIESYDARYKLNSTLLDEKRAAKVLATATADY